MYCYGCYRLVAWIFKDINCACSLIMRKKLLVKIFFAPFAIYQTDASVHLIKKTSKDTRYYHHRTYLLESRLSSNIKRFRYNWRRKKGSLKKKDWTWKELRTVQKNNRAASIKSNVLLINHSANKNLYWSSTLCYW